MQVFHRDMRRVNETGLPGEHVDVVAPQLGFRYVDFGLDDVIHAEREVRHRDFFLHPIIDPVNFPVVKP